MIRNKAIIAAGFILAASPTAYAEEADRVLEEIVVTAEKRESSVQDTPLAISAFDENLRDDLGISSAADIANYTPSMTYMGSPNRIFIRGIGRVENSLGSEPGVAIFKDGIYTNEAASVSDNTFFTDRIEVLRGPQGTLYGRNAIGGAANVISKKPTDEFVGNVRLGAHNYGGQYIGASVSGPLSDKIRYRIAIEDSSHDGYIDNKAGGDQSDLDFQRYELQFEADITENLNVWVQYSDYEWDQNRGGTYMISEYNTTNPGQPIGDFDTDFQQLVPNSQLGYTVPNPAESDIHEVNFGDQGYITNPGDRATVHVTYNWDSWQLKYIYGYNDYDWEYLADYDRTSRADETRYLEYIGQKEDYEQHELQLISNLGGKVEFIFGLFNWQNENEQPYTLLAPDHPLLETPVWADYAGTVCFCVVDAPANPDRIFYDQTGILETDSSAAYAQMDYYMNDQWHFTFGLRYSEDEKEGYEEQRLIFDGQGTYAFIANVIGMSWFNFQTPTPGPQSRIAWDFYSGYRTAEHKDDWDSTDWSFGADYKPNEDVMYYGKISTGYKSGGYRLGGLQSDARVDEENVMAYELGMKRSFDTMDLNAAFYYYDYEDMQVPVNAIINGVNNLFFQNAEDANQWGIELDMRWAATENLTVFSTYSYMDTEIDSMGRDVYDTTEPDPVGSDLSGNELIKSPPHKLSVNADYTWNLESGELKFVTSYVYTDEQWSSIFNRDNTEVPSFERTDFRVTYRSNQYDLRVSAYVRNAFDEEIIESISRSSWYFNQQLTASIQPPRTYGIEINYGF